MEGFGGRLSALSQIMSPLIFFHAADRVYTSIIVHGAHCTTNQDSTFYVSVFIVSGKREGEEKHRETSSSLHYYFFIPSRVYCQVFFHTGFCLVARN